MHYLVSSNGIVDRVYPILVLHSALLPLNVVRLREMKRLIETMNRASSSEASDSLLLYMTKERHRKGKSCSAKAIRPTGCTSSEKEARAFRSSGNSLPRSGLRRSRLVRASGRALGERAACEVDCRVYAIAKDKVLELYYQNPRFGCFLIRLVSGIVQRDDPRAFAGGHVA